MRKIQIQIETERTRSIKTQIDKGGKVDEDNYRQRLVEVEIRIDEDRKRQIEIEKEIGMEKLWIDIVRKRQIQLQKDTETKKTHIDRFRQKQAARYRCTQLPLEKERNRQISIDIDRKSFKQE